MDIVRLTLPLLHVMNVQVKNHVEDGPVEQHFARKLRMTAVSLVSALKNLQ